MAGWLMDIIDNEFNKSKALLEAMASSKSLRDAIEQAVDISVTALRNGNKLLFAGNGGSAADAQHWAGELVSRFNFDRPGLPAIALTTDTSILTAIGNDYGYDYVFARQVEALAQAGDVLFAISTSGKSKNILRAVDAAKQRGVVVIGFTGQSGGDLVNVSDVCLQSPSSETPKIQEGHEILGHMICGLIEHEIFANERK
jgi:D-sedoheptulose 7-phosphate isomerase